MANKIKKISINDFKKAIRDNYASDKTVEWNGLQVVIKKKLNLTEMLVFVENVAASCFSEDKTTYNPELKDCAVRAAVIELYTNISLPFNVHKKYDLLYGSDIFQVVIENIDTAQFNDMMNAIDEKIENTVNTNLSLITKQVNDLYASLENIQQQLTSTFADIGADDVKNIVAAISNGGIDEEKLMKAYIENKPNSQVSA